MSGCVTGLNPRTLIVKPCGKRYLRLLGGELKSLPAWARNIRKEKIKVGVNPVFGLTKSNAARIT